MRTITRTIPTSTINVQEVSFKDGKLEGKALDPVIVKGEEVTQEKASKFVKDTYGKDKSFVVTGIEVKEEVYEVTLEEFLKVAKIVTPTATQAQETTAPPATK